MTKEKLLSPDFMMTLWKFRPKNANYWEKPHLMLMNTKEPSMWKSLPVKLVILQPNALESARHLMFAEFGVDTPAKEPKPYCLPKLMQKFQPVWCPTRITTKLPPSLKITSKVLL